MSQVNKDDPGTRFVRHDGITSQFACYVAYLDKCATCGEEIPFYEFFYKQIIESDRSLLEEDYRDRLAVYKIHLAKEFNSDGVRVTKHEGSIAGYYCGLVSKYFGQPKVEVWSYKIGETKLGYWTGRFPGEFEYREGEPVIGYWYDWEAADEISTRNILSAASGKGHLHSKISSTVYLPTPVPYPIPLRKPLPWETGRPTKPYWQEVDHGYVWVDPNEPYFDPSAGEQGAWIDPSYEPPPSMG